ncbi:hypothetical protein [Actinacidiphila soli]|uniref:hypothetical protein n=1 Tax=Actinacidiphila soli TaxID=2487275 RepID=UPI000FCC1C9D|nr:hypothetical protein [Actinacidiphila soli]
MADVSTANCPVGQANSKQRPVCCGPPAIRRPAERDNTVIHWPESNPGRHHFVAMTTPGARAADLRDFFGKVR